MHWEFKLPGDWDQLGGLSTWHLRPAQRGGSHEGEAGSHDTDTEQSQNLRAMMQKMATVVANLQHYKSQAEELWKANQAQDEQLKAVKDITSASTSKLAFKAALGVSSGPFQQNTQLKYQKILFNIGSGYNPATGILTAMVRGVYCFRFTMYNNNLGPPNSVVSLMMNSQKSVTTWDTVGNDNDDMQAMQW